MGGATEKKKKPAKVVAGRKQPSKRRGWTTDDQFAYLDSLIPIFKAAQLNGTTSEMWPPIEKHWFTTWGLDPPNAKELAAGKSEDDRRKAVMERIKAWFGNHARDAASASTSKAVLDLSEKRTKKRSALQAYSKLYYKTKVRAVVKERWDAKLEEEKKNPPAKPSPKNPTIDFRNQVTQEFFDKETPEVREEVEDYRNNPMADVTDDEDEGDDNDLDEAEIRRVDAAKKLQKSQQAAINTMARALAQIEREADMIGVVSLAGPDPENGGSIRTITIFQGTNAMGHSFDQLYGAEKWWETVEGPLGDFSEEVFPPEFRSACALPGTEPSEPAALANTNWRALSNKLTASKASSKSAILKLSASKLSVANLTMPPDTSHNAASTLASSAARSQTAPPVQVVTSSENSEGYCGTSVNGNLGGGERSATAPPKQANNTASTLAPTAARSQTPPPMQTFPGSEKEGDSVRSIENGQVEGGERPAATPPAQASKDKSKDVLARSPEKDSDSDDGTIGTDRDGEPDPSQDSGAPSTAEEHAHLLSLDAFSREQDIKLRRRKLDEARGNENRMEVIEEESTWSGSELLTALERDEMMKLPIKERKRQTDIKRVEALKASAIARSLRLKNDNADSQTKSNRDGVQSTKPTASSSDDNQTANSAELTAGTKVTPVSLSASIAMTHPRKESWPVWVKEAIPELEKHHDLSSWKLVIWEWLEFEHILCYPSGRGKKFTLANNNRPEEIGDWFQIGRNWAKQPLIPSEKIARFSEEWWKWWGELQPSFRLASKDLRSMSRDVPDGTDWSEVMKGGNNGLFIVVISLGWWAKALQFAARDMGDWDKAIGDVGWVIDHIKCCQLQRKHDRDEEDSTGDGPETKRPKTMNRVGI